MKREKVQLEKGFSHSAKILVPLMWAHQALILGSPDYK
jgi:hypothetical protein